MELGAGDRFGPYLIESVLGRGGMGVVYLARDSRLGRHVALKVLAPELVSDAGFRARFEEEARVAASLDEPHVVPVFEAGEHDAQLFLAMRYVAGFDLETILRRDGPLTAERAVGVLEQLAGAVDAAHAVGLVHRDIKTANVLLASASRGADYVYLTDFGLARTVAGRGMTRTGQFVGSLAYAAPEQFQNGPMDGRTDIYALGGVLFASLTGHPPFEADTDAALMFAHLQAAPRAPSGLNAAVPPSLDAVVIRAMAKRAEDRYPSAGDLAAAARAALGASTEAATLIGQTAGSAESSMRSGGSRKTVTVMSVGLVPDALATIDPERVISTVARSGELVREVVTRHGGKVEALIGDSAICVFGVPQLHEDDALRSVRAALELMGKVGGVGIATGEVLVTSLSGRESVAGEPLNAAARLENAAQSNEILLDNTTYLFVRDDVEAEARQLMRGGRTSTALVVRALKEDVDRPQVGSVLVGRDSQLRDLDEHWRSVLETRSPRLVTIVGAAGIGKSRLAYALVESIHGRSVTGRCLPYGDGITYWPIREIVLSLAGITGADAVSTAQARITDLLAADPEGGTVAGLVATAIGLGQGEAPQSDVFWAVRRLFEGLSRGQPTLILIEDLEWAEDTLLDLLEYVVELASDAPLLMLTTTRPELLERRPGWATNRENVDLIRVDPLGSTSALELVRAQPGGSAIPQVLAERICATVDGNPLFVEEIVGALRDSPALTPRDDRWEFTGDPEVLEIPLTIRALLGARIENLPADERFLLECAAVVGGKFEADALGALAPNVDRAVRSTRLRSLVRRELIQADRAEISTGDAFRFRHILVRDAAYALLPKSERAVLHTALARWLVQASGERADEQAEIIGYHLAAAHDYLVAVEPDSAEAGELAREAAQYLRAAGERANARGDLQAAAKLLARCVALTPSTDPHLTEILVALADVRRSMGEFKVAREGLNLVLDSPERSDATDLRARIELLMIDLQTAALPKQPSLLVAELRAKGDVVGDEQTSAMLHMAVGGIEELEGRNSDAARTFAQALLIAERSALSRLRTEALSRVLLNELLGTTPVTTALGRCEKAIEESSEPHILASALDTYALLLAMADRTAEAVSAERRALEILTDMHDQLDEGVCRGQGLSVIHALAGDLETARKEALAGCELLVSVDAQSWLSTAACILGEIEFARGSEADAARWLSVAEAASVESDIDARTRAAVLRGRLTASQGSHVEARELTARAAAGVRETELLYLRGIAAAAEACAAAAQGDVPTALARLTDAAQLHEQKGDVARRRRALDLAGRLPSDPEAWRRVALV